MKNHKLQLLILLLVFATSFSACAVLQDMFSAVGGAFEGNTKREQNNYNLEYKRAYRTERYLNKVHSKEEEQEILRRLYCPENKKNKNDVDDELTEKLCRD